MTGVRDDTSVDSCAPSYAELMNGAVDAGFFGPATIRKWKDQGRDGQGQPVPVSDMVRPVDWDHDEVLPLPSPWEMIAIKKERDASAHDASPLEFGPVSRKWYTRVQAWLRRMREKYQPGRRHVTGSWRKNFDAWKTRLRGLKKSRRARILHLLMNGVELPFDKVPDGPLRTLQNHRQLAERSDVVWSTVKEMWSEGSIVAHDCRGSDDMDVLPWGMFAIRWVRKGLTDKVRITINMRPLNAYLLSQCSTVELASLQRITSLWQRDDEQCSLDMHSSYYHLELNEEASMWSGFSVADSELPDVILSGDRLLAIDFLRKHCSCARWRDRWVFRFRGMPMGLAPSAARYCECSDALMDTWRGKTVGRAVGLPPEPVRLSGYIDDSLFLVQGFARGIELGLRVTLEYLICGYWVNFDKSLILPSKKPCYLGCLADSSLLRFSLPASRCEKIKMAARVLREGITPSGHVHMRLLAKFVGNIWAIHVVARRAVAIMCRSMIDILATELRQPWLRHERDAYRLKCLLKRVWGGTGVWTSAAELELRFWESVRFSDLWAPMRQWDLVPDARDCILRPIDGGLHSSVRVFAADSSDSASGGAEFVVVKNTLTPIPDQSMVVTLSREAVEDSSTYAELEGLCKLFLACVRVTCRRIFFLVDNAAAMRIVLRGSRLEKLNFFAKLLFHWSFRSGILLCPLWMRRDTDAIVEVDSKSRLHLSMDFALPMHLFWKANSKARSLWGIGFQFDRFASCRTVMPMDCRVRLPFNSEFCQPGSSGRNALAQDWRRCVNWVNAPFCLLDQILGLLMYQHAVAAVVVPRGTSCRWNTEALPGCKGFRGYLRFNPRSTRNKMVGSSSCSFKGFYDIVFVDYRVSSRESFCNLLPAESLRPLSNTAVLGGDGGVVYSRVSSPLHSLSSSTELVSMSSLVRRVVRCEKGTEVAHARREPGVVGT